MPTFYGSNEDTPFSDRVRKKRKKMSAGILGNKKGMWRKTDAGLKQRRFTIKQRQTFRARRDGDSGPSTTGPR